MINIRRRRVAALVIFGLVIFFDLILSIYHLTHGNGWRSGTTEMVMAAVLATAMVLLLRSQGGLGLPAKSGRARTAALVIMGACTGVFVFLSPYHFTHHGLRSGIIEAVLICLLVLMGYLMAWPSED